MSTKIIVVGVHTPETIERFRTLPGTCAVFVPHLRDISPEDCADAQILVGGVSRTLVGKMPDLKFVQLFSAGADRFSWLPERIVLANAYGAYGDAIAEHLLTATLMAMKRMPEYVGMQDRQEWDLLPDIVRFEGSRILSVGMGAIGSSYLKKAHALGAVCYGVRRTAHDKPDYVEELTDPGDIDRLLPSMDVVALSLPGTAEVDGMFDERRLRLMKETAILLNVGRGNAVVTEDLIRVMKEGRLRAACLDVMDPEPLPKGHPLWTAPRVYITPHVSGGYQAGMNYSRVIDTAIRNLTLVLNGEPPIHEVDRKLGY